jgi:ribonuclease HII
MVMAAVVLDSRAAARLTRAGLRDSKSYGATPAARAQRAQLAEVIFRSALQVSVQVIDVTEIDGRVQRGELNVLEREVAERFIAAAPSVDRIVADGKILFGRLTKKHRILEAHNNGESKHAAVAAASVVAKDRRDRLFASIAGRYASLFGPVSGGGYANAQTRLFLRAYAERFRRLPPEARRSWPYPYLRDILGADYDPYVDCPAERAGQFGLFHVGVQRG